MAARFTSKERASIFRASKRVFRGAHFDVRVAPAKPGAGALFLVVPASVGNAVTRNLIKRRARAIFHERKLALCGYYLILFAKPGAAGVPFVGLQHVFATVAQHLSANCSLPA